MSNKNNTSRKNDAANKLAARPFVGIESLESRQLMSAGTPVSGFGTNGLVNTHIVGSVNQEEVQSDGKVLLFSTGQSGIPQVTRFNANGSLDTTYATGGGDGNGILTPGGSPTCVALQSNDKLIVAGSKNGSLMVARYNINGTLDTSYGTNGVATVKAMASLGSPDTERALAVIVDSSNRVVVLEEAHPGNLIRTGLVRFNANGSTDTTFGDSGISAATFTGSYAPNSAGALAEAPDKTYVEMLSNSGNRNGGYIYMERVGESRSSTSFNLVNIGTVFGQPFESDGSITTLAVTPSNKIVFGGSLGGHYDGDHFVPGFAVVGRLTASLEPDPTFNGGLGYQDLSFSANQVSRVIAQANGKIILGATSDDGHFNVQRLNNNGSSDTTFGVEDGRPFLDLYGDANSDVALLPSGQILIAASSQNFSMSLVKLTNDVGGISGTVKAGSTGLAGQVVYIDSNNNGKLDTTEQRTLTNALGQYSFLGENPGTYKLRQSLTGNYTQSQPTGNAGISAAVTAGQLNSGNNFTDVVTSANRIVANVFNTTAISNVLNGVLD